MKLVIDTDAYSLAKRGDEQIKQYIKGAQVIYVPLIVLGELEGGFKNGSKETANLAGLERFLQEPYVGILELNRKTSKIYGELAAFLAKQGKNIPTNDLWIAALCAQYDLPLLSRDNHFKRLPQVELLL